MNDNSRGLWTFAAAVGSGVALLASGVAAITITPDQIVGWVVSIVGAGFLLFVKEWLRTQKEKDRAIMDTLRAQNARQAEFERMVSHFMGQVQVKLNLHSMGSDPEMRIAPKPPAESGDGR